MTVALTQTSEAAAATATEMKLTTRKIEVTIG